MKEVDGYTDDNRFLGILLEENSITGLKYPLKLASASFKGTYEDLDRPSYPDPNQGFYNLYRKDLKYEV